MDKPEFQFIRLLLGDELKIGVVINFKSVFPGIAWIPHCLVFSHKFCIWHAPKTNSVVVNLSSCSVNQTTTFHKLYCQYLHACDSKLPL